MTQGIIVFAFNTDITDYAHAARSLAFRAQHFLKLPVTVITDANTVNKTKADLSVFDKVITVDSVPVNYRRRRLWLNKNRYQGYELSPYDDTILLDVDYIINSAQLLKLFEQDHDLQIVDKIQYLMTDKYEEKLGDSRFNTLWATVIRFQKTTRAKQFFDMIQMIQENYQHYSQVFRFYEHMYRNDYAATIALKTVNGQLFHKQDFIPWPLTHIPESVEAVRTDYTAYTMIRTNSMTQKQDYIKIKDQDFHVIKKGNLEVLCDE